MVYDKFFVSYNESNAEDNWKTLLKIHPDAKRIHGIKGIKAGYLACQHLSTTEYFWAIDGDIEVIQNLDTKSPIPDKKLTFFYSIDSIFGWHLRLGSIKLWRTGGMNPNIPDVDFGLFASEGSMADMDDPCGIHHYAHSPFDAWRALFRITIKALAPGLFRPTDSERIINRYKESFEQIDMSQKQNGIWVQRGYYDALALRDQTSTYVPLAHDYLKLQEYFLNKYQSVL